MTRPLPHNYNDLAPTVMRLADIYHYLNELIELAVTQEYDRQEICEGFRELIQVRMADNHHTIKPEHSKRVFMLLSQYWPENEEHLDLYLIVLINLYDVTEVRKFLESKLNSKLSFNDKYLIKGALSEI